MAHTQGNMLNRLSLAAALAGVWFGALSILTLSSEAWGGSSQRAGGWPASAACALPPQPASDMEDMAMTVQTARSDRPGIPRMDMNVPDVLETAVFGLG